VDAVGDEDFPILKREVDRSLNAFDRSFTLKDQKRSGTMNSRKRFKIEILTVTKAEDY